MWILKRVREKGKNQGDGMYMLSMTSKQGKNSEKDINIIAYPKKWQMQFSYIDMNEKADKMTGTAEKKQRNQTLQLRG